MAENETQTQPTPEDSGGSDFVEEALSRLQLSERDRRIDLLSAFLLPLAVLASAFSAWQATVWSGENSVAFSQASTRRLLATQNMMHAFLLIGYDAATHADTAVALSEGNDERLNLFRERLLRPDFAVFFEAWLELDPLNDPDAPRSPFFLEESHLIGRGICNNRPRTNLRREERRTTIATTTSCPPSCLLQSCSFPESLPSSKAQ